MLTLLNCVTCIWSAISLFSFLLFESSFCFVCFARSSNRFSSLVQHLVVCIESHAYKEYFVVSRAIRPLLREYRLLSYSGFESLRSPLVSIVAMSHQPPSPPVPPNPASNDAFLRLAQLESMVVGLQSQNQRLMQQMTSTTSTSPASSAQPGHGSGARPKAPPMVQFNGNMGSNGFAIDQWLREVQKQFVHFPQAFPDGAARIQYATSWLIGSAADWWENEAQLYRIAHPNSPTLVDWDEFVERLRDRYRPQLPAELARQRLRMLVQRGRVDQYCNQFLSIVAHIPNRSEQDKIFDFKAGLDRPLAAKVAEKQPETLQEAMEIAVQAEPYVGNHRGGPHGPSPFRSGSNTFPRHGSTNQPGRSEAVPMDLSLNALQGYDGEAEPANTEENPPEQPSGRRGKESHKLLALTSKIEELESRLLAIGHRSSTPGGPAAGTKPANGGRNRVLVPGLTAADIARLQKEGRCFRCQTVGHMKDDPMCPMNRTPQASLKH